MTVLAFARPRRPHVLAAIPDSGPLSKTSLNGFGNAILTVTTYCNQVRNTNLAPVTPGNEPAWYATLNANLTNMKTHAQAWIDTIGPSMTAIPQAIINYDDTFEGQYATIVALLTVIGGTPTPQQKKDLLTEMNALLAALGVQQKAIQDANVQLIQFNDNLTADHTALTTGASSVTNALTSDKTEVQNLTTRIQALNADLQSNTTLLDFAIAGLAIGAFACLAGIVLAFSTFGIGVVVAIGGFVAVAGSATGIALAEVNIQNDTHAIQTGQTQLDADKQQIVILNSVANSVDVLYQQNTLAGQAMDNVLRDWSTLMFKVKNVIDSLEQAEGNIGSILEIGDMASTRMTWQQLAIFATNMQTTLSNITLQDPVTQPANAA
jgi:uncharacterized membrane-anchored protein YhcB (DUF1043 family)